MTKLAIATTGLTKVYEKPQGWRRLAAVPAVTAVANINLAIQTGELFGLLGPNGAGKTTLVKMLCTLILPSEGEGRVAGYSLTEAGKIRAAVGLVVSDERSFYWRLSARRNLAFFAAMHGLNGRFAQQRINQVLQDVDLLDVADRRFSNFSSGMRQRLAIARSLLHEPQVLFLDEPTRSLDPVATQRLHELVLRLMAQREITVFLITHDLAEAEKLCGRVALMHKGTIRATGKPTALREQLRPFRTYTIQTDRLATAVVAQLQTISPDLQPNEAGHEVTFRAGEQDGVLTAVLDHLRQNDHPINAINITLPTLEEVFTHYTQE